MKSIKGIKIVYIMHVPWGWIKQRPQFIAEGLNINYQVTVLHPYILRGVRNFFKNETSLKIRKFYNLPPYIDFILIRLINLKAFIFQFGLLLRKADIIWLTHPYYYSFIKLLIRENQKVIY